MMNALSAELGQPWGLSMAHLQLPLQEEDQAAREGRALAEDGQRVLPRHIAGIHDHLQHLQWGEKPRSGSLSQWPAKPHQMVSAYSPGTLLASTIDTQLAQKP